MPRETPGVDRREALGMPPTDDNNRDIEAQPPENPLPPDLQQVQFYRIMSAIAKLESRMDMNDRYVGELRAPQSSDQTPPYVQPNVASTSLPPDPQDWQRRTTSCSQPPTRTRHPSGFPQPQYTNPNGGWGQLATPHQTLLTQVRQPTCWDPLDTGRRRDHSPTISRRCDLPLVGIRLANAQRRDTRITTEVIGCAWTLHD